MILCEKIFIQTNEVFWQLVDHIAWGSHLHSVNLVVTSWIFFVNSLCDLSTAEHLTLFASR